MTSETQPVGTARESVDTARAIFLYGSLMAKEILGSALGIEPSEVDGLLRPRTAVLAGYARYKVQGASFPALVPLYEDKIGQAPGVQGVVVWPRGQEDVARLDEMERVYYTREEVNVRMTSSDEVCKAYTYVWKGSRSELEEEEWDYQGFSARHLQYWLK